MGEAEMAVLRACRMTGLERLSSDTIVHRRQVFRFFGRPARDLGCLEISAPHAISPHLWTPYTSQCPIHK